LIIHKQSKHRKSFTACGLRKILFPDAVTKDWEKVTCINCKRMFASNETAFWKFKLKCRHHINNKVVEDGKIFYRDYCTNGEFTICNRHSCKILKGGIK